MTIFKLYSCTCDTLFYLTWSGTAQSRLRSLLDSVSFKNWRVLHSDHVSTCWLMLHSSIQAILIHRCCGWHIKIEEHVGIGTKIWWTIGVVALWALYIIENFLILLLLLRIQVSVQILIPLIFYSSQFILLIFHSCKHLQSAGVCCDSCDCTFSQECDSVTSALFQRLRYEFMGSSLFFIVSYFSFRQFIR